MLGRPLFRTQKPEEDNDLQRIIPRPRRRSVLQFSGSVVQDTVITILDAHALVFKEMKVKSWLSWVTRGPRGMSFTVFGSTIISVSVNWSRPSLRPH